MFREYLGRSRTVPLNVRLTSVRYLPDITPHLPRFSALKIEVVDQDQLGKIASHFSEPAPNLRTLSISGAAQTQVGIIIPPGFFGGDFASLRTLQLTGFSFLREPQHFPQLTRFDIRSHAHTALRAGGVLEALEQMPSLEFLRVEFCPDHYPPSSSTPTFRFVTLPRLREVQLSPFGGPDAGSPIFTPPLLSALTLPSVERITIGVLPPTNVVVLPSSFEEQLPNFAETATVDLRVDPEIFSILFHGLRESGLLFKTHCGFQHLFLRDGFRGTPFLSVKKMVVTFNPVGDIELEGYVFELLRAMGRLECLEIRGQYVQLLRVWSESPMNQRTICPSLRSLVVVKTSEDSISGLLAKLMAARKSHGVPLVDVVEVVSGG